MNPKAVCTLDAFLASDAHVPARHFEIVAGAPDDIPAIVRLLNTRKMRSPVPLKFIRTSDSLAERWPHVRWILARTPTGLAGCIELRPVEGDDEDWTWEIGSFSQAADSANPRVPVKLFAAAFRVLAVLAARAAVVEIHRDNTAMWAFLARLPFHPDRTRASHPNFLRYRIDLRVARAATRWPYGGPASWRAPALRADRSWIVRLTEPERADLRQALDGARRSGLGLPALSQEAFLLSVFADTLARTRREVEQGRGFALLRGIPVEGLTEADAAAMCYGLGAYLGQAVAQNKQGDLIGHVRDMGRDPFTDQQVRGYQSQVRLPFHSDAADCMALLCLRTARVGGEISVCSSVAVHDEMVQRYPAAAEALYGEFCFDRRGEEPAGAAPHYAGPMFTPCHGRLFSRDNRVSVEAAQRLPGVPPLTVMETAAFDVMDRLCNDPEFRLDLTLEPGDLQILNNHAVLHSRAAFEDGDERDDRRHLLRLWLRSSPLTSLRTVPECGP